MRKKILSLALVTLFLVSMAMSVVAVDPANALYISDMTWTSSGTNTGLPWGIPRNLNIMSSGKLVMDGKTFDKGFVLIACSDGWPDAHVEVTVPEGYHYFETTVGLDSIDAPNGKFEAKILVNGVLTATTGVIGKTGLTTLSAHVSPGDTMRLVLANGGDGANSDTIGWGNARLLSEPPEPPEPPILSDKLYISNMTWQKATSHVAFTPQKDKNILGGTLLIADSSFPFAKGIGTHAPDVGYADIEVTVPSGYTYFESFVGLDLTYGAVSDIATVEFILLENGNILQRSGIMRGAAGKYFRTEVTPGATLTLRVTNGGDTASGDAADWGDAAFYPARPNGDKYIGDLCWSKFYNFNNGTPYRDKNFQNQGMLSVGGGAYTASKGVGMHPEADRPAFVSVDIEGLGCSYFYAVVGKNDATVASPNADAERICFTVSLDGKVLYKTDPLMVGEYEIIYISVDGGKELVLSAESISTFGWCAADWCDAKLTNTPPPPPEENGSLEFDDFEVSKNNLPLLDLRMAEIGDVLSINTRIVNKGASRCTSIYLASYLEDRLVHIETRDVAVAVGCRIPYEISYTVPCAIDTLKVFVWEKDSLTPLVSAFSVTNRNYAVPTGSRASVEEKLRAKDTYDGYLDDLSTLPVSFKIGNTAYKGLPDSDFTEISRVSDTVDLFMKETTDVVLEHTSGLLVTVKTAFYPEHGAFEWTLYFENPTSANSLVISDINAADINFYGEKPVLIGVKGDQADPLPYAPYYYIFKKDIPKSFTSTLGLPTHDNFPYYNLEYGNGGAMIVVGWGGTWFSNFTFDGEKTNVNFGQTSLSSYLEPGEVIRTPLASFLLYDGRNEERETNLWRRWYIDCNMPKAGGEKIEPMQAGGLHMIDYAVKTTEAKEISYMERDIANGLDLNMWWIDAGWYSRLPEESIGDIWFPVGSWLVDTGRFPTKLKNLTDYANTNDIDYVSLWFEPEAVRIPSEELYTDGTTVKPSWLYNGFAYNPAINLIAPSVVNLGNPEALDWMIERYTQIMKDGGINLYIQDSNLGGNLSIVWKYLDSPGRSGIAENKHIMGYYKLWDSLLENVPGLIIDACASGGNRFDLETLRRGLPLHTSDYLSANPNGRTNMQAMRHSIYKWFPYFATITCQGMYDTYLARLSVCPMPVYDTPISTEDYAVCMDVQDIWYQVRDYFDDDYYTLTDWNMEDSEWIGWEFFDPDIDRGFAQIFRRENSTKSEDLIRLKGLDSKKTYKITDYDGNFGGIYSGAILMGTGVNIVIPDARSACVFMIDVVN